MNMLRITSKFCGLNARASDFRCESSGSFYCRVMKGVITLKNLK